MDTQREMLEAGVPKRLKSDSDAAVPFYYSGKSPSPNFCFRGEDFLIRW